MKRNDITGKTFGKWTVKEYAGRGRYVCKCDCSTIKTIYAQTLVEGTSTNCGCLRIKHGLEGTKVYRLWAHMKERCFYSKHKSFKHYGGRGITVCNEWLDSATFIKWALSNGYKEGLTLERKDYNGNYEPSNCEFIPLIEQANNRRSNRPITINGETKNIAEWARIANIGPKTLRHRIEAGWNETNLLKPAKPYKKRG